MNLITTYHQTANTVNTFRYNTKHQHKNRRSACPSAHSKVAEVLGPALLIDVAADGKAVVAGALPQLAHVAKRDWHVVWVNSNRICDRTVVHGMIQQCGQHCYTLQKWIKTRLNGKITEK